ncbi:MAG: peptidylprolyl isomerase [Pseudomonadota bacterium]
MFSKVTRRSAVALAMSFAFVGSVQAADAENTLLIGLEGGTVEIELNTQDAPNHAARLKELAREGFYDGVVFHRVIEGFMAQTGDPTGTGMGGSDKPDLEQEFSRTPFERGTVGMARSQNPNSANSQFFIMFEEGSFLNGQYTVVGQVVSGMEYVDAIKKGDSAANGVVQDPDKMIKVQVAADAQ